MISIDIKEATKGPHLELERKVIKKMKDIRNNGDYADLLSYFYAYFIRLEQEIAPFITDEILPDYKNRRKAGNLKNDIEQLGGTVDKLPETTMPEIRDHLQALGALYVMEGSVMGGGIIVKMLSEKNGIKEGFSFFSGYGDQTRDKWAAFTERMNQLVSGQEQKDTVIAAANQTFSNFAEMMN